MRKLIENIQQILNLKDKLPEQPNNTKRRQCDNRVYGTDIALNQLIDLQIPARMLKLDIFEKSHAQSHGAYLSPFCGRGMEYSETRSYQRGDDIRHMDWRVTARYRSPHTKLFQEERERPVYIIVDLHPAMYFGTKITYKATIAKQAVALCAWRCQQIDHRVGGFIFTNNTCFEYSPKQKTRAILPMLKQLSQLNYSDKNHTDYAELFKTKIAKIKPGSLVILISDFVNFDQSCYNNCKRLRQNSQVLSIFIYDLLEKQLPPPGSYTMTNDNQIAEIHTYDPLFVKDYEKQFTDSFNTMKHSFQQAKIPLFVLSTEDDVCLALSKQFQEAL